MRIGTIQEATVLVCRRGVEYVVPLRWDDAEDLVEFTAYLRVIAEVAMITVVDGSVAVEFDRHTAAWGGLARQLRPGAWPGRNRKVAGVVTGVLAARHDLVVVADDDVRYRPEQLVQIAAMLDGADLIRPQNVFSDLPWQARWDTARMLVNRAFGADYPGTFALRRSMFVRMGGYDGDALFENLQMIRTVRVNGGHVVNAADLFVARRSPTVARFVEQRVRQAYDDFAQPVRLVWEASWLPLLLLVGRRPRRLTGVAGVAVGIAEVGRRRGGGAAVFPATSALWAPLWVVERAVCVWLAILGRLRGGVRYRGERLPHAARPVVVAAGDGPNQQDVGADGSQVQGWM